MRTHLFTCQLHGGDTRAAPATRADAAIADYSRDVHGQHVVIDPLAHRDDTGVTGHRFTERTLERKAA